MAGIEMLKAALRAVVEEQKCTLTASA